MVNEFDDDYGGDGRTGSAASAASAASAVAQQWWQSSQMTM